MGMTMEDEIKRWTAKRKAALVTCAETAGSLHQRREESKKAKPTFTMRHSFLANKSE